ncbi:alpha-N-arabinofuranosidase [Bifidobacterium felsineum]|uniref:non-reducing end alpha-L-arabinofuranosidase n=1 Tax=Bifidobacterium felsineum TaxID=2045440 RepID=A0A2M9HM68_9BIFI|nr:alpha-L-arabinofuranosidase C-terminal domain-containing protein [Bifidobacterium felsineum]MBT1163429.1 alpha-L-arabinofuranosidase [Bifidobacterium felsineum]PJM77896.1 alpha-L-arabinofuranosidase [Bifidobacterium felsineum]
MQQSNSGPESARLVVDNDFEIAPVNNRLFGSFVEHLGRCVYSGIYEPGHPEADDEGFRKDVIDLVRELGVTTIRYPGGNFVSGYRWEDGVGPKTARPRRLDLAWHSTETNQFGLHEMVEWLQAVGGNELMEAVNLGTRGLENALDLLEYANVPNGTELSERRRANGADNPFGIKMWCLGNEMDGPWQTGHKNAEDYGTLAASVAAGMRMIDPDVELVVCGSSHHDMDTFGKWEETVLEKTYENVDFISCHAYYHPESQPDGTRDMASFLASGVDMDSFIKDVAAIIDATKARLKSDHDVFISFDEWNVWYINEEPSKSPEGIGNWPEAPKLLEDVYSVADAVVLGDLLITLLKNADRVHAASLAQLVNVIAPIMTEPGGPAWKQTTFYPFALTAHYAKGGMVLEPKLSSGTYETAKYGTVPSVNSVAVRGSDGSITVFATNRSMDVASDFEIKLPEGCGGVAKAQTLHESDMFAANTRNEQNRVVLHNNESVTLDSMSNTVHVTLPPVSWTAVHVG